MSKTMKNVLIVVTILLIILGVSIVGAVLMLSGDTPSFVETPRILHLKIPSEVSDSPREGGLFDDPDDHPPLSTEITRMIYDAAKDDNVTGIHFEVGALSLGWAQYQEIRGALKHFEENGKTCTAWSEGFDNKAFYLASACSEIHLAPAGVSLVNGLSITQSYYADFFEEWGIEPNFAHVGDFKSAVEPYERTGPSESASEATNLLLDSLYDQLLVSIEQRLDLSEEDAKAFINDTPITPNDVLDKKMVDKLSYRNAIFTKDNEYISTKSYLRQRRTVWEKGYDTVAVLYTEGSIVNGESGNSFMGGSFIGDHTLRKQLNKILEDDSVKALVLRVNSPGGSGSASDSIWNDLRRIQDSGRPVVISMGDYAASGGYYISMGADYIYAMPGTLTGSIGVFGGKLNMEGLYEKIGIKLHTYKRGEQSNIFSSTSNFSDSERRKYQEFLDGFYKIFVEKAAQGRDMTYDELHQVAQGRVWTGEQALERNLVDELGGLEDAIAKAKELAELGENDVAIRIFPKRKTALETILEDLNKKETEVQLPIGIHSDVQQELQKLDSLLRVYQSDVVLHLPFQMEIQ